MSPASTPAPTRPVLIFGVQENSEVALSYLRKAGREVVAFTVDRDYLPDGGTLNGLPLVALEDVPDRYPPSTHDFLVPLSHQRMNRIRETVFGRIRELGYAMPSLVDSGACVHEGVRIGDNCFVLEQNVLQPGVSLGENVVLWSGNHIGHHSTIGDHCFVSSHVVIGGRTTVGSHCFFGMNATVRDGATLGDGTYLGMGATVTSDTEPWSLYVGTPARRKGSSQDLER